MMSGMPSPSRPVDSPVGDAPPNEADLAVTEFLDHDVDSVTQFATEVTSGMSDDVTKAVALFTEVRDRIWYNPYDLSSDPADHRASSILAGSQAWCVPKSVLLSSACRTVGIPARLGFSDVRNHLQSPALDFDGRSDALLHAHDGDGNQYMEYVNERGIYNDLPLMEIFESFSELYGSDLLDSTDD